MFKEGDVRPCSLCSMYVDQFNGVLPHVRPRASLVVVAKALPEQLAKAAADKGWVVPLLSTGSSTFGEDMGVSFTPEQVVL
jgi:predicted dithiol-disulfide oxidoreductase (DUF899 family)